MKKSLLQAGALTAILLCAAADSRGQIKFDFEDGELPPDTTLYGNARLASDGTGGLCLHLTDPVNSQFGQFRVPNVGNGKPVRQVDIRWRSLIGGGSGGGADGYSLNWAADLPSSPDYGSPGEEGAGSGLTVTVDTFDNGGGEAVGGGAPGIELRWRSNVVAFAPVPNEDPGGGLPYLRRNQFVEAQLTVAANGEASFTYDGVTITALLNGWKGLAGADVMLGARTGGANDRHWIDNLQITSGLFTSGVFNGLFYESGSVMHERSGFVSLKLNPKGRFSGYLVLGGVRYPLRGAFDVNSLASTLEVPRPGSTTLTVALSLDNKDTIRGTVTDGIWVAVLQADRQIWNSKTQPANDFAGASTVVIDNGGSPTVPQGYGYGVLRVDTSGRVKLAGSLGDGTKLAQRVTVSRTGVWPFFASLYGGKGSALGWIQLSNMEDGRGRIMWTKRPGVPGPLYPAGFVFNPDLYFSPYVPPLPGMRLLNMAAGAAAFEGGDLLSSFASELALTPENKVIDLSDDALAVKFVTKSGLFRGMVTVPGTATKLKFAGVAFQAEDVAAGLFLGTSQSGSVIIGENP